MTAPASPAADEARLADRQQIHDLILSYCRGVDRLDLDLVRDVYHPGAVDHHTGFDGPVEDYISWVGEKLRGFDGTMHLIANHLVQFAGPRAIAETYGTAVHWGTPMDDPLLNFTSGFRYVDLLECRDRRWGIVERYAVRDWTLSDAQRRIPVEAPGPRGSRTRDDIVFRQIARLRSDE
jgi:SnoaL-like domain